MERNRIVNSLKNMKHRIGNLILLILSEGEHGENGGKKPFAETTTEPQV
jgi:hypothetical protein